MGHSDIPYRALGRAVELFNRNPWTSRELHLVPRSSAAPQTYDEDGLKTAHAHHFVADARFQRAYARAVQAGTFDYGIRWRAHTILWAAQIAAPLDGAFVECGTARGFMASAICDYLDWSDRPYYLFDTFESTDNPDEKAYYADGVEPVIENFAEWRGVQIVVGRVPNTFATVNIERVAFLHVDMNMAAPEEAAVRHFWPRLVPGAAMVFDDYGFGGYGESRASVDRLAAELGFAVLASPTGQGVVVKTS